MITHKEYRDALRLIDDYVKQIYGKNVDSRYIVKKWNGCAAILDTHYIGNLDGYYSVANRPDLVEYKDGYYRDGSWHVRQEDIDYLDTECGRLNENNVIQSE